MKHPKNKTSQNIINQVGPTEKKPVKIRANLRSFVGEEIPKPFPWIRIGLATFGILLLTFGLYLFSQRYEPEYIEHRVLPGETIITIAKKYNGKEKLRQRIFDANREKLMKEGLQPGSILRIPKIQDKQE